MIAAERLTLIAFLVLLPWASAVAQTPVQVAGSQNNAAPVGVSLLDRPAKLSVAHVPLEGALLELTKSSGVPIAFSPARLPRVSRVSCECEDVTTVGEALERLLRGTRLEYLEMAGQIVLYPAPAPKPVRGTRAVVTPSVLAIAAGGSVSPVEAPRAMRSRTNRNSEPWQGTVTGVVTTQAGEPIAGAQVALVGTQRSTITDERGGFTLARVPVGEHRVRVMSLGYRAETRTAQIVAGETASLEFVLAVSAIPLDAIVVHAVTGEAQRKRELGNAVTTIRVAEINTGTISTLADVLSSRAPGVNVLSSSGTVGAGSRIRIRGSSSASLSNEPLILVDGVRLNNSQDITYFSGGQSPSRLNDISPENIETIDVLKGPAASALYGTAGANGVILITTRRGRSGETQWHVYSEAGQNMDVTDYPANFRGIGRDAAGEEVTCDVLAQAAGACTFERMVSFNPLKDQRTTPFRAGTIQKYGLSVSGGSDDVTYFVGGDWNDQEGVYESDIAKRVTFGANVGMRLNERTELALSAGYTTSDVRLPPNDNHAGGYLFNGLNGHAEFDPANPDAVWTSRPPRLIKELKLEQEVERFIGTINASWLPVSWLRLSGTTGLDLVQRHDHQLLLPERIVTAGLRNRAGFVASNRLQIFNWTGNAAASATFPLTPEIMSTSTAGFDYHREKLRTTNASGVGLLPGTSSLNATSQFFTVGANNTEVVTIGGFVRQQLGLSDRVFLAASIRGDDNSAFGSDFGLVTYPALSASWVISEEEFFPQNGLVSALRLRASFGRSGQRPEFRDAKTYFMPVPVRLSGVETPGLTIGGTGNPDLEPEKTDELEFGFELGGLQERVSLDLTYYNKTTKDLLVSVPLAPSLGVASSRFENLASSRNRGVELELRAQILDNEAVTWNVLFSASTNKNVLKDLGPGISPIIFGQGSSQRHAPGFPLGGYWQRPILGFADSNGDGILSPSEVTVGDTVEFLGSVFPTRELSLWTRLTIFRYITVRGTVDYRGGHKLLDETTFFRCGNAATFFRCREAFDPTMPLASQAKLAAYSAAGTRAGFIHDADFIKLRELSLTLAAPPDWARLLRTTAATATISGRNLATWTDYPGLDPELNAGTFAGTGQPNFITNEIWTQPPVRVWSVRLDLRF